MTSSVSFRITRTAEDLAQTITTLSQRLVKLEQRQEALELQMRQQLDTAQRVPEEELATLDGIEQLLQETRQLLQSTEAPTGEQNDQAFEAVDHQHDHHHHDGHEMAA